MSITNAKTLRVNMTDAERKLWKLLRSEPFQQWKFRRQHTIGKFIADFACVEAALIIEVDGGQHCESAYDDERTAWLKSCGWVVLRFWNNEVLQNSNGVAEVLKSHLESTLTRRPTGADLSHRGEVNTIESSHA